MTTIHLVSYSDLPLAATVIRASFTTVADEFGLTEQNCPNHTSFITAYRREKVWPSALYGRLYGMGDVNMEFYIKTGMENMQIPLVHKMLQTSYWAHDRAPDLVAKSMLKSDCYGAFLKENDRQIGFARVVTDDATFFWLCDVIVDEEFRGQGVGKKLMETIRHEPKYKPMAGILGTLDAHGLYEKYGFCRSGDERLMRKPKGV